MRLFSTIILLSLGTIGIGGWYKFHNLKPKTLREYLEWQGLKLISDSESNYWKAVIEENKKLIEDLSIDTSKIDGVREWCQSNLSSENYEDLKVSASLLCVDKPKTVKARIIQLDGDINSLIQKGKEEDNQYKVAYVFRKHIAGFNALIGYSPELDKDGNEIENLEVAKDAFKNWCTNSLEKPLDETLVLNIRELCTPKKFSSIKQLIAQRGEEELLLTKTENLEDLKTKHESIKELDFWKADNDDKLPSVYANLFNWCKKYENKSFYEDEVFSKLYPKFRFRCLKGSNEKP